MTTIAEDVLVRRRDGRRWELVHGVVVPIPGIGSFYAVDVSGNVYKQVGTVKWPTPGVRIVEALKIQKSHNGYAQVKLTVDGRRRRWFKVGATVLRLWKGPPPVDGGPWHCAHEDGDQTNNHITNLSWKLQSDNEADKKRHGTRVGGKPGHKRLTERKRRAIIAAVEAAPDGTDSYTKIARRFGVHRSTVARVMEKYDDSRDWTESVERAAKASAL